MKASRLEVLASRLEVLEEELAKRSAPGRLDWLKVVGISEDNEFTRSMIAEIEARHEAEREAALEENPE